MSVPSLSTVQRGPLEADGIAGSPGGGGASSGWRDGGVLDRMAPGPALAGSLAGLLPGPANGGMRDLDDDELAGVLAGWHRLGSWAAAGELAAVSELLRRRHQQAAAAGDRRCFDHVDDEVAVALRLTKHGASRLLDEAYDLERLPGTAAALARGRIDRWKAHVIGAETTGLEPPHAAAVEAAVLPRAEEQTTGELRVAARRAVLAVDPAAVARRRDQAGRQARVEEWAEDAGTAAIAGRDLPPAPALAAGERINELAHQLKDAGAPGTMDQLRARAFVSLLTGQQLAAPAGSTTRPFGEVDTNPDADAAEAPASQDGDSPRSYCQDSHSPRNDQDSTRAAGGPPPAATRTIRSPTTRAA